MYTARARTHPNWLGLAPTRSSRTSTLSRPLISPLHALSPDGYRRRRRRRFRPSPSPSCAAAHRHVLATVSFTESPAPPCRSVPARAPAANPSRHGAPARLPRLWLLSPRSLHRLHVSSACAVVRLGSPPTPTRLPCGYPCASVSVCVAARSALDGAVVPPHALWCGGGAPAGGSVAGRGPRVLARGCWLGGGAAMASAAASRASVHGRTLGRQWHPGFLNFLGPATSRRRRVDSAATAATVAASSSTLAQLSHSVAPPVLSLFL